ncbi:hypothetical protein BDW22DRAFT_1364240 [Trametopsis cervina]|nr:hypothetical protein BDW22DRAFT_1364240 [Trametopsis cervina]
MDSSAGSSARFSKLYRSLPLDAQQTLVEKHLIPLLDRAPRQRTIRAHTAAARLSRRHRGIPALDLRAKKAELKFLFDELKRDAKHTVIVDASNKPEILQQIVNSASDWFGDIWSTVYEHNVNYELAHECLTLVCHTITRLTEIRSCCECSLANLYIPVTLRSKAGRVIKTFHIDGAQNLEMVTQFIWREMFLSILANGKPAQKEQITEMLSDIESLMGWKGLMKILWGGKRYENENYEPNEQDEDEWNTDEDDIFGDDFWPNGGPGRCQHWSSTIFDQMTPLQALVENAMKAVFEVSPSVPLYHALLDIAIDLDEIEAELLKILGSVATFSSDTLAVTLDIYAIGDLVEPIVELLDSHSHLLRPRDAASLQAAVIALSRTSHLQRALTILQAELMDTAQAIRQALMLPFSRLDEDANRAELTQIMKSRQGLARGHRVEAWVDAISSPGLDTPNPLMFAALMMGVAPMPGMNPDDDAYSYLDLDPYDPDLEDLRHEFRPNLKKRFESWSDVAITLKGGPAVLLKVYQLLIESMPFLRVPDATEEMINRLQDRLSKQYICDGLDSLLAFVKVQRRKFHIVKTEMEKNKDSGAQQASKLSSSTFGNTPNQGSSSQPLPTPPPSSRTPTNAIPVAGPVPISSVFHSIHAGPSSGPLSGSAPASSNAVAGPSNISGASTTATPNAAAPIGVGSHWAIPGQFDALVRASRSPSPSTQPTHAAPPALAFPFLFGGTAPYGSLAPGPSLDDVD